jgi:hypothetical protein
MSLEKEASHKEVPMISNKIMKVLMLSQKKIMLILSKLILQPKRGKILMAVKKKERSEYGVKQSQRMLSIDHRA